MASSGVGLGESVQKAFYLPEAHTDMIAAVIGEELGLVGMFVLVGLFGMFGYAGLRAAHRARDRYSKLLAAGLTSLILAQATLNLFAVLGLAPLTGVPLPFVSYGGTEPDRHARGCRADPERRPEARRRPGRRAQGLRPRRSQYGHGPCETARGRGRTNDSRVRRAKRGQPAGGKRAASGTSRDSGRRHGGARRTGDGRRRRASR